MTAHVRHPTMVFHDSTVTVVGGARVFRMWRLVCADGCGWRSTAMPFLTDTIEMVHASLPWQQWLRHRRHVRHCAGHHLGTLAAFALAPPDEECP